MTSSDQRSRDKILVLVVDIDDDIGTTGIKTPIIGYRDVLEKAIEFAKKKPQDSDVNSIFGGLAAYEKLSEIKGRDKVEIAIIAGYKDDMTKAFLKIHEELKRVKDLTGFNQIYLVSDGVSDEQVIPILSVYGHLIGVERIIVEQSKSIEETYIVFLRYLRKAFTERPYTKYFLGLPGLLFLAWGLLSILGLSRILWSSIFILLGMVFIIKGFNILGWFHSKWELSPIISIFYLSGSILIGIAILLTGIILYNEGLTIYSFISLINYILYFYFIGSILIYGGRIFEKTLRGKYHFLWHDSLFMVILILIVIMLRNIEDKLYHISHCIGVIDIIKIIISSEIMLSLLVAIAILFVITVTFTLLEKRIKTLRTNN